MAPPLQPRAPQCSQVQASITVHVGDYRRRQRIEQIQPWGAQELGAKPARLTRTRLEASGLALVAYFCALLGDARGGFGVGVQACAYPYAVASAMKDAVALGLGQNELVAPVAIEVPDEVLQVKGACGIGHRPQ